MLVKRSRQHGRRPVQKSKYPGRRRVQKARRWSHGSRNLRGTGLKTDVEMAAKLCRVNVTGPCERLTHVSIDPQTRIH